MYVYSYFNEWFLAAQNVGWIKQIGLRDIMDSGEFRLCAQRNQTVLCRIVFGKGVLCIYTDRVSSIVDTREIRHFQIIY